MTIAFKFSDIKVLQLFLVIFFVLIGDARTYSQDPQVGNGLVNPLREFESGEKAVTKEGTLILSPDGRVHFIFPSLFTDIKKTVWAEAGYSYFSTGSDPHHFLVVRVYNNFLEPLTPELLEKRIIAEMAAQGGSLTRSAEKHVGREWKVVTASEANKRFFSLGNAVIYEVQMLSDKALEATPWVEEFWKSLQLQ